MTLREIEICNLSQRNTTLLFLTQLNFIIVPKFSIMHWRNSLKIFLCQRHDLLAFINIFFLSLSLFLSPFIYLSIYLSIYLCQVLIKLLSTSLNSLPLTWLTGPPLAAPPWPCWPADTTFPPPPPAAPP